MNRELLEEQLSELPLYIYDFIDPAELEFSQRIRWICQNECPKYGTTWACPPGVGTVEACQERCMGYHNCLLISSIAEVAERKAHCHDVFLSPIYDSISKEGYAAAYSKAQLLEAARNGIIDARVMALGGISAEHLPEGKAIGFGGAVVLGDVWNRLHTDFIPHFEQLNRYVL